MRIPNHVIRYTKKNCEYIPAPAESIIYSVVNSSSSCFCNVFRMYTPVLYLEMLSSVFWVCLLSLCRPLSLLLGQHLIVIISRRRFQLLFVFAGLASVCLLALCCFLAWNRITTVDCPISRASLRCRVRCWTDNVSSCFRVIPRRGLFCFLSPFSVPLVGEHRSLLSEYVCHTQSDRKSIRLCFCCYRVHETVYNKKQTQFGRGLNDLVAD